MTWPVLKAPLNLNQLTECVVKHDISIPLLTLRTSAIIHPAKIY